MKHLDSNRSGGENKQVDIILVLALEFKLQTTPFCSHHVHFFHNTIQYMFSSVLFVSN